ncbi:hypothetical protein GCM10007891_23540 [Methylophaga thalassica]|uniref:Uncharacterized protein n=1 Tax=Methylophaga thalassica TaxID=40223 RepID=A0ABQ5TYJ5_9GAMM|nr:hypothetical protein GCM10007891_23540 [Methylophaga thalassica]
MVDASLLKYLHSTDNKNVALFSQSVSRVWLYFSRKLIAISFKIRDLIINLNYKATSLIFIMKPLAS